MLDYCLHYLPNESLNNCFLHFETQLQGVPELSERALYLYHNILLSLTFPNQPYLSSQVILFHQILFPHLYIIRDLLIQLYYKYFQTDYHILSELIIECIVTLFSLINKGKEQQSLINENLINLCLSCIKSESQMKYIIYLFIFISVKCLEALELFINQNQIPNEFKTIISNISETIFECLNVFILFIFYFIAYFVIRYFVIFLPINMIFTVSFLMLLINF